MNLKNSRFLSTVFWISITCLILLNFKIVLTDLSQKKAIFDGSKEFPGEVFLPLKPYLKTVRFAGYYTDYAPAHPDTNAKFAYYYQRAQFALAPTMLDHQKPWDYDYVIVFLYNPLNFDKTMQLSSGTVIARVNQGIFLIKKNKI